MRNRQRGAYSFLFLVVLIAGGLLVFALAADGARLYAQQRILQQHADAIALAAAQGVQTCGSAETESGAELGPGPDLVCALAEQYIVQNRLPVAVSCDDVITGYLSASDSGLHRFEVSPFPSSNSVRVTLEDSFPRSLLLPGRLAGQVSLTATSTARRQLVGTFSSSPDTVALGGEEASVLNTLLTDTLGMPIGLGVIDYQELRQASAGLGDFVAELSGLGYGGGSLETLLGSDVPADILILALQLATDASVPAGQILDDLLAATGLGVVRVSDILDVVDAASVPPDSRLPVYDVLVSTILNLAEGALVELPVNLTLPGVADVRASVRTDRAPTVGVGPSRQDQGGNWVTSTRGADISVELTAEIDLQLPIPLLGELARVQVDLPLTASTGASRADFTTAGCARGFSNFVQVGVGARTAVADIQGAADISVGVLGITLIGTRLVVDLPVGSQQENLIYPVMDLHGEQTETVRAGRPLSLTNLDDAAVRVEGSPSCSGGLLCSTLNLVLAPVIAILDTLLLNALLPVVGGVLDAALDPLLTALGIELGTASITVSDLHQSQPVIVRTID